MMELPAPPPAMPLVTHAIAKPMAVSMGSGTTLSPEQMKQLRDARRLATKVRRAYRYAAFEGWSIGIFGLLTLLTSITSIPGLLLGLGMIVIAAVEVLAAGKLRKLDARAARTLGFALVALAILVSLYAAWNIYLTMTGPGALDAYMNQGPEVANIIRPYEPLLKNAMLALYGSVIAISIVIFGGTALYYFTRAKHVRTYLEETPAWIIDLQRAGVTI